MDIMKNAGKMTLKQTIQKFGWPSVCQLRGKIFFVLNTTFGNRGTYTQYKEPHSPHHPLMFLRSLYHTAEDDSVFTETCCAATAHQLVNEGYIVRWLAKGEMDRKKLREIMDAGVQYIACNDVGIFASKTRSTYSVSHI